MHAEPNPHSARIDAEADRQLQTLGRLLGKQMNASDGWTRQSSQPAAPELTDEPTRRRLEFVRVDALIANPSQNFWLMRGMLELDSLALIFGEPGVGKSFLAVDWSVCIATGTAFCGHKVQQGGVLFIAGEGGNGLARRFSACAQSKGLSLDEVPLFISTMATAMTDVPRVYELLAIVTEHTEQHGAPALIVVDTVARNFGPGDENSTKDMTGFIAACDALRVQTGACVLLVHHCGHSDKSRARGSMALKGALDWEYGLSNDESGALHLNCTKVKDAEQPEKMAFLLKSFELGGMDDEGDPITSAVLVSTLYMPSKQGKSGRGKNQTGALRILHELMKEQRARLEEVGEDPDLASVSRVSWRNKCGEQGMPPKRFSEALKSLREGNHVYVNDDDQITMDFACASVLNT